MARESAELVAEMTTRTWLAGQALAGLIVSNDIAGLTAKDVAEDAVSYADAVLEVLNRSTN